MYIYTYIHIYIYASLQRRTTTRYVCMYVCMYTHIYTHTHRQTHTHYEVFADIPTTLAAIALNLASMLMRDGVRACGHVGVRVRGCMGFFFVFRRACVGFEGKRVRAISGTISITRGNVCVCVCVFAFVFAIFSFITHHSTPHHLPLHHCNYNHPCLPY